MGRSLLFDGVDVEDGAIWFAKAPSTNIQAPEKSQAPNFKWPRYEIWSFVFDVSLELGAWNLELKK
jgi:hypothetical protein